MDYYGDDRVAMTVDTGKGFVAADEFECIEACIAQKAVGCNAVSYYGALPAAEWYAA